MGQSVRVLVGPRPPPGYVSRLFTRGAGVEAFFNFSGRSLEAGTCELFHARRSRWYYGRRMV